jgi:hypothetical protein
MEEDIKTSKLFLACKFHQENLQLLEQWKKIVRDKYGYGGITYRLEILLKRDLEEIHKEPDEPELDNINFGNN